ncbi:uncharacterized protein FOMMEDRAFT_20492 [Fomitiporia mediterranea MF3/22]|uniref:uncharacterized protein n=1 Tax=Fomitiporia mediterranea (strain MF3/22) TaxID=694068 RepID=UPI0004408EF9|nr:uncharacterized protein FOMMEDRAFT_20492 [Fomitiporia mediterranea MF3/22]EJD03390.1 hypothetical protein FOMMEDRAFT_20492 [Fomitiporia mediterranea MF3/22]
MGLHEALRVSKIPGSSSQEGCHYYKTDISREWCIGGIPQGGYAVGLILSSACDLQSNTPHPDPVHLTAHFLQPVDIAEVGVRVNVTRRGKRFTNIDADLVQDGKPKITARMIFGVIPDLTELSASSNPLTLTPPSPNARRIPLSQHPSLATPDRPNDKYLYQIKSEDRFFEKRNAERAKRQAAGEAVASQDCGLEWGAWLEFSDPKDVLDVAMMPFLGDTMKNLPSLLPREHRPGPSWFATVVLTLEFKSRIPSLISNSGSSQSPFSPRTVGIYSSARFMSEGRHDAYVEIWTAPSTIGSANPGSRVESEKIDAEWREKQVCLAIATQMALTIPEENSRRSRL